MQINVLGAERRRRWSYDEKIRLVEETLQQGLLLSSQGDANSHESHVPAALRDSEIILIMIDLRNVRENKEQRA